MTQDTTQCTCPAERFAYGNGFRRTASGWYHHEEDCPIYKLGKAESERADEERLAREEARSQAFIDASRKVAGWFGGSVSFPVSEYRVTYCHLHEEEQKEPFAFVRLNEWKSRIEVSACWPKGPDGHEIRGPSLSIGLAENRWADNGAKELNRRFFPEYRKELAKVRERVATAEAIADLEADTINSLIAAGGTRLAHLRNGVDVPGVGYCSVFHDNIRIERHLGGSVDEVLRIAAIFNERKTDAA